MRLWFASLIAAAADRLVRYLLATKNDQWFSGAARFVERTARRLGAGPETIESIDGLAALFESGPETSAVARRFVLESPPVIFRAVVRGALMD